jgi:malate dehydrogenase (quinone)
MLDALQRCFSEKVNNGCGARLREMIPSFGQSLIDNPDLCRRVRDETAEVLNITRQQQ